MIKKPIALYILFRDLFNSVDSQATFFDAFFVDTNCLNFARNKKFVLKCNFADKLILDHQ